MPVEMRMLTYYNQDSNEKLTNFSSRDSNNNENLFLKRKTSVDSSFDSTSHNQTLKNDNVYKPFKQEKHKQSLILFNFYKKIIFILMVFFGLKNSLETKTIQQMMIMIQIMKT